MHTSSFKRGGVRATANARLQSAAAYSQSQSSLAAPSCLGGPDPRTLAFAKWSGDQVYDWLCRNGFEAYFPMSADGFVGHKWIRSGLHLLQASPSEYEKELGETSF